MVAFNVPTHQQIAEEALFPIILGKDRAAVVAALLSTTAYIDETTLMEKGVMELVDQIKGNLEVDNEDLIEIGRQIIDYFNEHYADGSTKNITLMLALISTAMHLSKDYPIHGMVSIIHHFLMARYLLVTKGQNED